MAAKTCGLTWFIFEPAPERGRRSPAYSLPRSRPHIGVDDGTDTNIEAVQLLVADDVVRVAAKRKSHSNGIERWPIALPDSRVADGPFANPQTAIRRGSPKRRQ